MVNLDTILQAIAWLVVAGLFAGFGVLWLLAAIEDNSACDELPLQRLRVTPDPPRVTTFTLFDQDALS